ncbi:hypothetical protein BLA39750_02237 [Burkholderia lata]|uniref:Holin n=1 Tax=Burkholderia lata (strain ATCC 17760 / DSM 23089 / LMG 22485 / NCIMB 9086 / R18194 / 383) TaxID=482957 RepID=A0A6P2WJ81_BURL3|nr:hypothetical protein [Burkholderia lata]VWC96132.1 hypothetical protein BLA39750_02237 [Burkholderia lata]
MKDTAVLSTAASTPAVALSTATWLGAHLPEALMFLTLIWTVMNIVALVYKFIKWVRK